MPRKPDHAPTPGPLGWLEVTVHLVRDRSHSGWGWLQDEELLAALQARGAVAAYLGGERIGVRDQLLLRLAVDPEGRVALATGGGPPEAGPIVQEFLVELVEELHVAALVDEQVTIGATGLPLEQLRQDAERPDPDTRQVYLWQADDAVEGRVLAAELQQPVDLHRVDGWVIAAVGHQSPVILHRPPGRGPFSMHPFAILDRRAELRSFTFVEGRRASHQRVQIEWGPPMRPAPPTPEGAATHPDTVALAQWLSSPDEATLPDPESRRGPSPTPQQRAVIEEVMAGENADGALSALCVAYGLPVLAAQLAEVRHGDPDPVKPWQRVEPQGVGGLVGSTLLDANAEPSRGRMPWHVLDRAIHRRPGLGLLLGFVWMLVAGGLSAAILRDALSPWWWIAVGVLVLLGMEHTGSAVLTRQARQRQERNGRPGSTGRSDES